jgi:hypothetical protein
LFPGRSAARSGALQTRDRNALCAWDDPGSAVHHFVLHRIRETRSGFLFPGFTRKELKPKQLLDLHVFESIQARQQFHPLHVGNDGGEFEEFLLEPLA